MACSGGSSRKGIPLDVWASTESNCPQHDHGLKSPWQTHRAGISHTSSAWSTSQPAAGQRRPQHSHNHHTACSSSKPAVSERDFPLLSTSKTGETAATVAPYSSKGGSYVAPSPVAPPSLPNSLIRDCVKELRCLFPNVDRSILEDVTSGIADGLKAGGLGDLLEQAVSRLLDVFSDDPGIRCAFPKFHASQPASAEPTTWKDKVVLRAASKQKKKPHRSPSDIVAHSSDMEFYRAAIESLTDRSARQEAPSQEHEVVEALSVSYPEQANGAKLRMQSHQIAESRAQLFAEAARAFIAGDTRLAKELSTRGHELTSEFRDLSGAAAVSIFKSKNPSLDDGIIDLHGLHKDEAFAAVTLFVERLRLNPPNASLGSPLIICGKGIHSKGAPVLQATAKEALISTGCTFHVLPGGTGTLAVTNW